MDVLNLFAEDLAGARAFYTEILRLFFTFENENYAVFKLENVIVSLWGASTAPELIAPAVVARPEAGSRIVLAVFVDDVEAACA